MDFEKENKQGVVIYHIKQERLDTAVAPELKADFLLTLENGEKNFLMDLTAVKYVDSSGLGALLLGLRQAKQSDGDFKLYGAAQRVKKLIEIAHLNDHLLCLDDEAAGLSAFGESAVN